MFIRSLFVLITFYFLSNGAITCRVRRCAPACAPYKVLRVQSNEPGGIAASRRHLPNLHETGSSVRDWMSLLSARLHMHNILSS